MSEIQKTKIVCIEDFSGKRYFKIRLFGVFDGLDFLDKITGSVQDFLSNKKFSIKEYLSDLIPLAVPMDETGTKIVWPDNQPFTLQLAAQQFENPVSIIELGWAILEFQQVFFERSEICRQLIKTAREVFPSTSLASGTKSEQS